MDMLTTILGLIAVAALLYGYVWLDHRGRRPSDRDRGDRDDLDG